MEREKNTFAVVVRGDEKGPLREVEARALVSSFS